MLRFHRLSVSLANSLVLSCYISVGAAQTHVSSGLGATAIQPDLIVPAERIGPLQLGMAVDEVFRLQDFHLQYDQDIQYDCGLRWLNFLALDFKGNLIAYIKNGRVVQIEALYPENYHTADGIRGGTDPQTVASEFPRVQSFVDSRRGSKISPYVHVYWVDSKAGIAFEMQFDPWEGSYEVFRIAVFHQDELPLVGCADVGQEWAALGESQLPPIASVPEVIGSRKSETVADEEIESFVCVTYGCLKAGDTYYYDKVDLDEDGQSEIIVYIQGTGHCGSGGCTFLVLKEKGAEYMSVSKIPGRPPVLITTERTDGWKNLVVWFPGETLAGGGEYILLKHNGTDYMGDAGNWPILDKPVKGELVLDNPLQGEYGVTIGH